MTTICSPNLPRRIALASCCTEIPLFKKDAAKSKYAFSLLHYEGFSIAEKEKYYVLRKARNDEADQLYSDMLEEDTDGLYMLDIMRGGIRNDDPRIPRNLSE